MKIRVVGGGPAGLFFAQLVKRSHPRHNVVVYERNRADDIFGFGVVFSDQALAGLEASEERTQRAIGEHSVRWETIDVTIGGNRIRSEGHGFSAISRQRLLQLLQQGAAEAGVEVCYETDLTDLAQLDSYDLLVGADGISSGVRAQFADELGARETVGCSKFIWCGSTTDWDTFRFIFEENAHGAFAVHGYPFDAKTCTFLVETDESSWRAAGLDRFAARPLAPGESDTDSLRYLEGVFRDHLEGTQLIGNYSRWLSFRTIECDRWHTGNAVLLGDAAHTAHFSVGSGTKMAMEDAIALNASLAAGSDLGSALEAYEQQRRPAVARIQRAAMPSLAWWESFAAQLNKPAEQFMFHFLTRTPQVTHENLRVRDRRLVAQVDRWWDGAHADAAGTGAGDALSTPIEVGGIALNNRVVTMIPRVEQPAIDDEIDSITAIGLARAGAGLVLSPPIDLCSTGRQDTADGIERWRRSVEAVHGTSDAKVGLIIGAVAPAASDEVSEATRQADSVGFDLVALQFALSEAEPGIAMVRAARDAWPESKALAAALAIDAEVDPDVQEECIRISERIAGAGCDLIALRVLPSKRDPKLREGAWRVLALSEQIRATTGLPTMIDGCVPSDDYARTAVLSGRADLCGGLPELGTGRWHLKDRDD